MSLQSQSSSSQHHREQPRTTEKQRSHESAFDTPLEELTPQQQLDLARRKQRAETMLLDWTERLMSPVAEEMLIQASSYFRPIDYTELLLERNLAGRCAYPPCTLDCPAQAGKGSIFRLSSGKIVDRDREVRFCDKKHQTASNVYAAQLSTEPLWYRAELDQDPLNTTYARNITLLE
ncbi:hypothetical protein PYCC9005_000785 [Savitreella phatthalungensis]